MCNLFVGCLDSFVFREGLSAWQILPTKYTRMGVCIYPGLETLAVSDYETRGVSYPMFQRCFIGVSEVMFHCLISG